MTKRKTSTKTRKGKGRGKSRALTKSAEEQVKKIVDRKLDNRVEDKFILDQGYTDTTDEWAADTFMSVQDLTFNSLDTGTGQSHFIGSKIWLKGLKLRVRVLQQYAINTAVRPNPDEHDGWTLRPVECPISANLPIDCYVVRTPAQMKLNLDADWKNEFRKICKNKFYKDAGYYKQDLDQNDSQSGLVGFKLLKHFQIQPKVRTFLAPTVNKTINADAGEQYLEDLPYLVNVPMQTNADVYVPINQKILIDGTSDGEPMKYDYILFCQFHGYHRYRNLEASSDRPTPVDGQDIGAYNELNPLEMFQYRRCWIYEDA